MSRWDAAIRKFNDAPVGSIIESEDRNYYLKPEQSQSHHLDECVIDLFSGKVKHFTRMGEYKLIYGSEVVW